MQNKNNVGELKNYRKGDRITVKEYEILRKKYMGTESVPKVTDNSMYNIRPKLEEEKGYPMKFINEINNKKNSNKNNNKNAIGVPNSINRVPDEEIKGNNNNGYNLDENGKEVLNENLFRNTTNKEFKAMRNTYSNKFIPVRGGSKKKDSKAGTMYNFHKPNQSNSNNNIFFSKAGKSYYNGFKKI